MPSKLGSRTQGPQGVKKEVRVWQHLKDESSANFLSICGIGFFTNSFAHGSRPALKKKCPFFAILKFRQKKTTTLGMFIFCVRRSMSYINLPCEFGGRRLSGLG